MPKEVKEKVSKKAPAAKTEKKKKDPNAPKRGLSAFMFFSNDKREEIKAANPGIAFGQVGKKAGEMWNALSEKEKEVMYHIVHFLVFSSY